MIIGLGGKLLNNYSDNTKQYLDSFPRRVANNLIEFEMRNNFTQEEAAKALKIDFKDLIKVEFNFPGIGGELYQKVCTAMGNFNKQQFSATECIISKSIDAESSKLAFIPELKTFNNFKTFSKSNKYYQSFIQLNGYSKENGEAVERDSVENSQNYYEYIDDSAIVGVK